MKFRKKPVVIDARQVTQDDVISIAQWCKGLPGLEGILIQTPEGLMQANNGDWVIRGVKGEFYPCKPDIFEQTYEAAE